MIDMNELFGQDLTNVDVSRPLLKAGTLVEMEIFDCKVEDNRAKDGSNICIFLRTKYQESNDKGGAFPAGYAPNGKRPTEYISLTPSEKQDEDAIKANLKRFKIAMGEPNGPFGDPSSFIGRTVTCKVLIEKDKNGAYPDKNKFQWQPPKK